MKNILIKNNLKVLSLLFVFLALFVFFLLKSYYNINIIITGNLATLWYWNYILIGLIAFFYIFKIHKFYIIDFLFAIILGVIMSINSGFNPIIAPITMFSYYAACCIFKKYNSQIIIQRTNFKSNCKAIGFGILVGIIPAILNLIEFYIQDGYKFPEFSLSRFLPGAMGAFQPGISEEIVFRFFLYAFILNAFKGEIPTTKSASILIYVLLILPHSFMHYPPLDFINNPLLTTLNLVYMSCVFGIPAVWLLKHKTLYSAIAFHWFVDFIRFAIVGH